MRRGGTLYEYEDIGDPDQIAQGDVIEWITAHRERPWKIFGVVVTADCDLAWNKHGGVISYVPGLTNSDFIWKNFRERFFEKRRQEALNSVTKLINTAIQNDGSEDSSLSGAAVKDWLARVGRDNLLDEIGINGSLRNKIVKNLDKLLICDDILNCESFDMSLLERAFAATEEKDDRTALIRKIEDQWTQLPGDIFHLPSLPNGEEGGLFLLLRHIRQISVDEVARRPSDMMHGDVKVKRIARVCPPYRYAITQNLARVFADIGLPEDHESRRKTAAQQFFHVGN